MCGDKSHPTMFLVRFSILVNSKHVVFRFLKKSLSILCSIFYLFVRQKYCKITTAGFIYLITFIQATLFFKCLNCLEFRFPNHAATILQIINYKLRQSPFLIIVEVVNASVLATFAGDRTTCHHIDRQSIQRALGIKISLLHIAARKQ